MKRNKTLLIIILSLVVGLIFTLGAIRLIGVYLDRQYAGLHEGCAPRQMNHLVVVKDNVISPSDFTANRCETLTVTNLDDSERMMAFGVHEQHVAYDGVSEKVLQKGESFTVVLIQTGSFKVHDHDNDEVKSTFEVK